MKSFVLFITLLFLFACGEPAGYDMTYNEYKTKLELAADELSPKIRPILSDESLSQEERTEKYGDALMNGLSEKLNIPASEIELIKKAVDRIENKKGVDLNTLTVKDLIESQKEYEGQ